MSDITPEKITIIEGPPPQFEPDNPETWLLSLTESPVMPIVVGTRLRTFNGPALVERCYRAWQTGRPVNLEYRDETGQTQHAEIVAARAIETPEGHVLRLFVRLN